MSHEQEKDRIAQARTQLLSSYRATFTSPTGKLVLSHLRTSTGWGRPAFLPAAGGGPLDPIAAAFRDGRKSVIDEIDAHLAIPEDKPATEPKATGKPAGKSRAKKRTS